MPRLACERIGAGARLGSPTTGVDEEVFPGAAEEAPEDSAAESGFVGFLRYAFFCQYIRSRVDRVLIGSTGSTGGGYLQYSAPWFGHLLSISKPSHKEETYSSDTGP